MSTLQGHAGPVLQERLEQTSTNAFDPFQEKAILLALMDNPRAWDGLIEHLEAEMFQLDECQYVAAWVIKLHKEHGEVPSRAQVESKVLHHLTTDDPHQPVTDLLRMKLRPLEVVEATRDLKDWLVKKTLSLVGSEEAIADRMAGNLTMTDLLVDKAKRIKAVGTEGTDCGLITTAQLRRMAAAQEWLVEDVLAAGKPCFIGGKKKSLKTGITCDLAVSIATGRPFLGHFRVPKPRKVAFFSAESGADDINDFLMAISAGKRLSYTDEQDDLANLHFSFEAPKLSQAEYLARMGNALQRVGAEVVIVDPLYMAMCLGAKDNAANLYDMGRVFSAVIDMCKKVGVTFIACHHFKKSAGQELDLDDFTFTGPAEFARQSVLIGRLAPYTGPETNKLQVRLHGHRRGGVYEVNVSEPKWQVSVQTMSAVKSAERDSKDQALVDRVLTGYDAIEETEGPENITASRLAKAAGVRPNDINRILALAVGQGDLVEGTARVHGKERSVYRRPGQPQ